MNMVQAFALADLSKHWSIFLKYGLAFDKQFTISLSIAYINKEEAPAGVWSPRKNSDYDLNTFYISQKNENYKIYSMDFHS